MRRGKGVWVRVFLGLGALIGAVILLWNNEGRVNWREVAANARPLSAEDSETVDGEFVAVTGVLRVNEPLDDGAFLRPGSYARIRRSAEMYAWVTDDDDGYRLEWTADPPSAEELGDDAPANPPLGPLAGEFQPSGPIWVGGYATNPDSVELPPFEPLTLNDTIVVERSYTVTDDYIYEGAGTPESPEPGDVRIAFEVVPTGQTVTAFGTAVGSRLVSYNYRNRDTLYRIVTGDRQRALLRLETEFRNLLWGFRGFGFCLTWLGLWLVLAPLTTLLGFIPILGRAGSRLLAVFLLPVAFILAALVALLSAIFHNIWALLGLALLLGGALVLWRSRLREKEV